MKRTTLAWIQLKPLLIGRNLMAVSDRRKNRDRPFYLGRGVDGWPLLLMRPAPL